MIVVPVTHDLIHLATVHTARLPLSLLDEVAEERGAWRKRHMVDIAVQGLVHSKDDLCHAAKSPKSMGKTLIALAARRSQSDERVIITSRCTAGAKPRNNAVPATILRVMIGPEFTLNCLASVVASGLFAPAQNVMGVTGVFFGKHPAGGLQLPGPSFAIVLVVGWP
jgi:hypothetical protein